MPPPLTGGTNNQRSYSGPTTGSAFDSRTIPGNAGYGDGNAAVMSLQFSQDQQQAGWDQQVTVPDIAVGIATGALPGWNANGIEALPGPLLNASNSWMAEFTPEAEQDLGYLLYGDLSGLGPPGDTGVLLADNGATSPLLWSLLGSAAGFALAAEQYAIKKGLGISSSAGRDALASANSGMGVGFGLGVTSILLIAFDPKPMSVDEFTGAFVDDTLSYNSGAIVNYGTVNGLPTVSYGYSAGDTCSEIAPTWVLPNNSGR